jgi:CheY-like chemotaxis protein
LEVNKDMKDLRVLVVDDTPRVLNAFERNVLAIGVQVDKAASKLEALEKVRRRAYHSALVDIMLTNDPYDRGGIEIIKKINSLDEGTLCIAISAHKTSEAPVRAYEAGVYKYLIKGEIRVPEDYLGIIRAALKDCKPKLFGRFDNLAAYLARPELKPYWESEAMSALGTDAAGLERILAQAFGPVLPVLRRTGQDRCLLASKSGRALNGIFWSRAIGQPIWVSIARKDEDHEAPPAAHASTLLYERRRGPENMSVWVLTDIPRDDFHETTLEVQ